MYIYTVHIKDVYLLLYQSYAISILFQDPASLIPAPSQHPACMELLLLIIPRMHCCLSREPQRSEKSCRPCPPSTPCSWAQLVGQPDWHLICNSTLYSHVLVHL